MRISFTSEVTIAPNAAPIMTAMARSSTLPRMTNSLNSLSMLRCYYSSRLGVNKTALKRPVKDVVGQLERKALEMDQVDGMRDRVAGLAAPKLLAGFLVVPFNESLDAASRALDAPLHAYAAEDLGEFAGIGTPQQHLVLNAPQKRL